MPKRKKRTARERDKVVADVHNIIADLDPMQVHPLPNERSGYAGYARAAIVACDQAKSVYQLAAKLAAIFEEATAPIEYEALARAIWSIVYPAKQHARAAATADALMDIFGAKQAAE